MMRDDWQIGSVMIWGQLAEWYYCNLGTAGSMVVLLERTTGRMVVL